MSANDNHYTSGFEDNSFDMMVENSENDVPRTSQHSDGSAITTSSFYGAKYSSATFYRTPKFNKSVSNANGSKTRTDRLKFPLAKKPEKKKNTLKSCRTTENSRSKTIHKKLNSILKPNLSSTNIENRNTCLSKPGKILTTRPVLDNMTTTLFSNHRISLSAVYSPKGSNLTTIAQRKLKFSSNNYNLKLDESESVLQFSDDGKDNTNVSSSVTHLVKAVSILDEIIPDEDDVTPAHNRFKMSSRSENDEKSQMMIDAGQKNVESIICRKCGMLYVPNSEEDSALHYKFHNESSDTISFNGWKVERVVREYSDGRVILVLPNDPKYALKKVDEVKKAMDSSLGITEIPKLSNSMQAFIFIADKKVVGCVMAETISKAYRVIARKQPDAPLCCSTVSQRAICGINRIWTATAYRRNKIASRLMDCVKSRFYYGCVVPDDQIAFTHPSPSGQIFAESYMKSQAYLVYESV